VLILRESTTKDTKTTKFKNNSSEAFVPFVLFVVIEKFSHN